MVIEWRTGEDGQSGEKPLKRAAEYPPDLADEAVQTVLAQAEILLRDISL